MFKSSIDIGSNSVRLLIARVEDSVVEPLIYEERISRLGEGLTETGEIKPPSIERLTAHLVEFAKVIETFKSESPLIAATSAARDAANSDELVAAVKESTGWDFSIIDGDTEAKLTAVGVLTDYDDKEDIMIVDPGGGSTEFIFVSSGSVTDLKSLDIGSRRLTERFLDSDPPSEMEVLQLKDYLARVLREEIPDLPQTPVRCVGVGGTSTTAAAMMNSVPYNETARTHKAVISNDKLDWLENLLLSLKTKNRINLMGLHPARADVIPAGIIILTEIASRFGLSSIEVSTRDLLFGLLTEEGAALL